MENKQLKWQRQVIKEEYEELRKKLEAQKDSSRLHKVQKLGAHVFNSAKRS